MHYAEWKKSFIQISRWIAGYVHLSAILVQAYSYVNLADCHDIFNQSLLSFLQ